MQFVMRSHGGLHNAMGAFQKSGGFVLLLELSLTSMMNALGTTRLLYEISLGYGTGSISDVDTCRSSLVQCQCSTAPADSQRQHRCNVT